MPFVFSKIVDGHNFAIYSKQGAYSFMFSVLAFALLWFFSKVLYFLREVLMFPVMERAVTCLTFDLYKHTISLPLSEHLKRKTGELTSILENALECFPPIVWSLAFSLGPTIIETIGTAVILGYVCGFYYSFILLIGFILFILTSLYGLRKSYPKLNGANQTRISTAGDILDSLMNFASVKYFHNFEYELKKIRNILSHRESKVVDSLIQNEMTSVYQAISLVFTSILIISFSGYGLLKGQISIGKFIMIQGYVLQFTKPLDNFGYILQMLNQSIVKMSKALELFDQPVPKHSGQLNLKESEPLSIEVRNVWFAYKNDILKGCSFDLKAGETIALVGETGSGKSTLINLILGFVRPIRGEILINGHNVNDIAHESFMRSVGIVPQDVSLFYDTLRYNIQYANPNKDDNELLTRAIHAAQLEKTIEHLPQGLETMVGERGTQLSGGERQRVGLARAIIRQPKLFIFDEPTSSLDSRTEYQILKNISEITRNTQISSIIISHKLSTVSFADRIYILEQGILKEISRDYLAHMNNCAEETIL